jgi:hypothetical protein
MSPGGIYYAFPMNSADFSTYGSDLGLESAASITTDAEISRVVTGSSIPRPGRANKELTNGSISAFYNPAKKSDLQQPTAGWRIQSAARLSDTVAATGTP